MIDKAQFQTARRAVQLGNAVCCVRNRNTRALGLTATQSEAIRYILKYDGTEPLTAADLMAAMQLSQSTVAGLIRRLEDKALIRRSVCKTDGRKSMIFLTEKGWELEEALKRSAVQTEGILLEGMSQQERAEFNRLLQKALDNMNTARNKRV